MRRYLKENLAPDEVVATWEWQLAINATPRFLFPTHETLNGVTIYLQDLGVRPPPGIFEPTVPRERYVLIGPFGARTGLYDPWVKGRQPQARFGTYALYDLSNPSP